MCTYIHIIHYIGRLQCESGSQILKGLSVIIGKRLVPIVAMVKIAKVMVIIGIGISSKEFTSKFVDA